MSDKRMLKELGIASVDELFSDIPPSVRTEGLPLPPGKSELEVVQEIRAMLSSNITAADHPCFMGGGIYNRFIPSAVTAIISRSEFVTSYTPYQAEISQGMLQALFEYQSYIAELTGMEVVNSSNYDAATALGEAATMCHRVNKRKKFIIPQAINFDKRSTLNNYVKGAGMEVQEYAYDPYTGEIDLDDLRKRVDDEVSGIYVEVPNFLGIMDRQITELKEEFKDPLLVVGVDPISLGMLKAPGDYNADIVIGEGQSLGSPMNFGGPLLGLFGCRQEYVEDARARRWYDPDLRQEGILPDTPDEGNTSAGPRQLPIYAPTRHLWLYAAVYLAIAGRDGLRAVAQASMTNARKLGNALSGSRSRLSRAGCPILHEVLARVPIRPESFPGATGCKGIIGGLPWPDMSPRWVIACSSPRLSSPRIDILQLTTALRRC